jgi:hypothetical protein
MLTDKVPSLITLLDEVEALCRTCVGKGAFSETWHQTYQRLARLDQLARRVRREMAVADHPEL